jgi:hypothetical protein
MMQPMAATSLLDDAERSIAAGDDEPGRARTIYMAEHDLHAEACAVLEISPDPQNSFEIAVVLSTLGYTDASATGFGCRDLFDMAERIYEVVELYFRRSIDDTPPESMHERMRRNMRYLLRGFSYVELWVLSLALIWVNKSSFWSGGTLTVGQATAISLALVCTSLLTGPVVQSFTRRYLFYTLQDNAPLARWVTSRVLYGGAALVFASILTCWFLLEHVVGAFTPDTNRVFLAFALLLASLQLGFAPLVASRSAVVLGAAVMSGAAVLVWLRPDGWVGQVDITRLFSVQAIAIATIFVVTWLSSLWVRRRHESDRRGLPRRALPPRAAGFGIGVAPYALYGALLFAFVFAPKLLAGGMLEVTYRYGPVYEGATDLSMLVLIPALVAVTVMTERFSDDLASALGELTITEVADFRRRVLRLVGRRFGMLVAVVVISAAAMSAVVDRLPWLLPAGAPDWLFTTGLIAYSLLALTLFCAQLLFVLCRPAAALGAMGSGMLVFGAVGVPLVRSGRVMAGPLIGFLAGSAVAAVVALVLMVRTARRADWAVYSAM